MVLIHLTAFMCKKPQNKNFSSMSQKYLLLNKDNVTHLFKSKNYEDLEEINQSQEKKKHVEINEDNSKTIYEKLAIQGSQPPLFALAMTQSQGGE